MKARRRRLVLLVGLAGALLGLLVSDPAPLLTAWRNRLQHWEELPRTTDAVFLLLGEVVPRAMHAAVIARTHGSPVVAMARPLTNAAVNLGLYPREDEVACAILRRLEIPDSSIVVLPGPVESTYDEAREAHAWAAQRGVRSIIFVTSSYHSARASWILRRVFDTPDISLYVAAVPAPHVDFADWWRGEDGLVTVFNETVKSVFYRLNYRGSAR